MYAIKTINLTKKYKDTVAVDSLNLEIKSGELFSLLGVNGAGKTTFIKMLSGLTKQTEGEAFVGKNSISRDILKVKSIIGVSPQETALAPNLTVKENLELFSMIYGLSKDKTRDKIKELTENFSLGEILNKKTAKLSGGWQRRVSIAISLISEPSVLFLDEPTLGIDVIGRSEIWDTIRQLKGKVTIILTTHYMEEAAALSDRIGIMKDGKLLVTGTAESIMENTNTDKFEDAFISIIKGAKI